MLDEHFTSVAGLADPPARREGSKSRWNILPRKNSMNREANSAAAAAEAATEVQEELRYFKAECLRQGKELQELQEELQMSQSSARQAQERANMQRFKYELLIDLVSVAFPAVVSARLAAGAAAGTADLYFGWGAQASRMCIEHTDDVM